MAMRFHVPGYEIELQPAGAIILALLIAMVAVSIVALVCIVRRRGKP
jgi:hypothetical protein